MQIDREQVCTNNSDANMQPCYSYEMKVNNHCNVQIDIYLHKFANKMKTKILHKFANNL